MRFRRLFALLTSVTMLHLSVVAGDPACATHRANGHHAASSNGMAMAEHAMPVDGHVMPMAAATEEQPSAAPVSDSDTSPCEIPAQRHCCEALIGCSVATAVTSAHQALATIVLPVERIRVALHDAPASFASAPEPPPPKA
jgi:hypothetical protein